MGMKQRDSGYAQCAQAVDNCIKTEEKWLSGLNYINDDQNAHSRKSEYVVRTYCIDTHSTIYTFANTE